MLGTSNGRQISKRGNTSGAGGDICGATRQLLVGYEGATRLADAITNALLDENNLEQWGIIKQPDRRSCHKGLGHRSESSGF